MASGFLSNGVDLDNVFQPRGSATPVANTGYNVAGVDLALRYAPRITPPVPVTGFKSAGVDLNQIFNGIPLNLPSMALFMANSASLSSISCIPMYMNGILQSTQDGVAYRNGSTIRQTAGTGGSATGNQYGGFYLTFGLVDLTGTPLVLSAQPDVCTVTYNGVPVENVTVLSPAAVSGAGIVTTPNNLGIILGLPPATLDTIIRITGTFSISGISTFMEFTTKAVTNTVYCYGTAGTINGVNIAVPASSAPALVSATVNYATTPPANGMSLTFLLGLETSRAWAGNLGTVLYTFGSGSAMTPARGALSKNLPNVAGSSTGTFQVTDLYGNVSSPTPFNLNCTLT